MTCVVCKHGQTAPGTTNLTLERGPTVLVVRQVPAEVCQNCGEAYVGADVADRVTALAQQASDSRVMVEVRDYAA